MIQPLILDIIKTNNLIPPSKYPIKYLNPFLIQIDFEILMLLTSTSQSFIDFCAPQEFSFVTFILPNLNIIILSDFFCRHHIWLSYMNIDFISHFCVFS